MLPSFQRILLTGLVLFVAPAVFADLYVDSVAGCDSIGYGSSDAPVKTLPYVIDRAYSGETIHLAAGRYAGATFTSYKDLAIVGDNYKTVFIGGDSSDGGIANYGGGTIRIEGVTFTDVADPVSGVTLVNAVISNCYSTIATDCMLYNCLIVDNCANWVFQYAISGCWLYGCTYANNLSSGYMHPGLSADCRAYNTIVWNNRYSDGTVANAEDGAMLYDCRTNDPRFVCADYGDYRLRADSPCRNAGAVAYAETEVSGKALNGRKRILNTYPDIGCFESDYVSGYVITTHATGRGVWSPAYKVVTAGYSATFTAACGGRPISSMTVDGAAVTPAATYVFKNV